MLYYVYVFGVFIANLLPLRVGYAIAGFIAGVYFLFSKRDREGLRDNLKVVLGADTSPKILDRHVFAVFHNFGKYLVDFFKLRRLSEKYIRANVELNGMENLDGCLKEGKGAILLTLHLGNWELGGALIGGLGYKINAIVLEHKDKRTDDFFVKQRALNNVNSIPIGLTVKVCFKALKSNGILAIVGDKDYTSGGTEVDFFGKKAILPKGPAVFSLRTGSPILFTAIVRDEKDKFLLFMEKPITCRVTGDDEADVKDLMAQYTALFEKYIRMFPDQWYVFKKIWNQE